MTEGLLSKLKIECLSCNSKEMCYIGQYVIQICDILLTHHPAEIILFEKFEDGIKPSEDVLNTWSKWLENRRIYFDEFLYNCILTVLDESNSLKKSKRKIKTQSIIDAWNLESIFATRDKLKVRQKVIQQTKNRLPIDEDAQKYRLNEIYLQELKLLFLNDELQEDGTEVKHKSPLLKLSRYQNIDNHNFTSQDIKDMIDYYNKIYDIVMSNDELSSIEKALILYHLELEIRFETIFSLLQNIKKYKIYDEDKLDLARGFCKVIKSDWTEPANLYYVQNRVFFGIKRYINDFCNIAQRDSVEKCAVVIMAMTDISRCINAIVDIISIDEKNKIIYDCEFMEQLCEKVKNTYDNAKDKRNIRVKDFINIYRPDNWNVD